MKPAQKAALAKPASPRTAANPLRPGCKNAWRERRDAISARFASAKSIAKVVCDKIMYDLASEHTVYGQETDLGDGMAGHLAGTDAMAFARIAHNHLD